MMTKIEMIRALIDEKILYSAIENKKYKFDGLCLQYFSKVGNIWRACAIRTIDNLDYKTVSIYTEPPKPKQVTFRVRCEKCDRVDTGMIITAPEDSGYVIECENDCYVTSDTSKQDALDALILVERIHDDVPMTDDKLNASERAIKILRAFIEGAE